MSHFFGPDITARQGGKTKAMIEAAYEQGKIDAREQAAVAMAVIIDKDLADPWTVTVGLEVVQELWDVVRVKSAPTNEDQHEDDGNHDGVGDEQDLVHPSTILPPAEEGKP